MTKIRFSQSFVLDVLHNGGVRSALAKRRDGIATRAEAITTAERVRGDVVRSEGTRPQGRPYARVAHTNGAQEHGTSREERRRILGRSL